MQSTQHIVAPYAPACRFTNSYKAYFCRAEINSCFVKLSTSGAVDKLCVSIGVLTEVTLLQGRDRDLLARRLSNATAASSAASSTAVVPALERRLSRRTSQQLPQWQQGRSSMQPNAVDLAMQRSGSTDMPPPALPQPPRRVSKMQNAASGAINCSVCPGLINSCCLLFTCSSFYMHAALTSLQLPPAQQAFCSKD